MQERLLKIRKYGILVSVRIFLMRVLAGIYRFLLVKVPWALRFRFYYHLLRLILTPSFKNKRILGIWDFKSLPWSIGDPLVFVEMLAILKIKYNAEGVDICVVYDQDNPVGNRGIFNPGATNISSENARDYMLEILPLFGTCPFQGSIYQFNSRLEFNRFLKENLYRYNTFPVMGEHLGEKYNLWGHPPILNPMQEFYNSNGYIPYLRIGERDNSWAKWLYLNYLPKGVVPVALSLKRTLHRAENNADPAVWVSFIDKCRVDFPEAVFVVVGLREEILEGLREKPNVIIAKDFGTSVIEDLALIRASLMYMGTSSGVNTIALFSDLPYLITQMEVSNLTRHGLKSGDRFSFMLDRQKIFDASVKVTPELLLEEFKKIYLGLDKDKWRKETIEKASNKHGHPVAKGLKSVI